ncbi:MAG TPA: hypothetical protein PLD99_02250 [Parcubacteria group bacterium]|nr:hypothetical protein [Parcubacteria group bacterium]
MKIFDKDGYKNKGRFLGWGSGPKEDWMILFGVFCVSLLIVAAYSGWVFYDSMRGEFASETNVIAESPIDIKVIKSTAAQYTTKSASFETLLKTKETTPDPSK